MEGDLQKIFGRNLRRHRLARGLSQEQMSEVLGVGRTYIGGLERGERNVSMQVLSRLARDLGVSDPTDLLVEPPEETLQTGGAEL